MRKIIYGISDVIPFETQKDNAEYLGLLTF